MGLQRASPLLRGAIEDFLHALEHMKSGSEKDNKYAVIHAATAVELLMKEKIRSKGISIFDKKPPYHSLDFYDCLKVLRDEGISIPCKADIELLHQERNICIHLGGKPDSNKTAWLIEIARNFIEEFSRLELTFPIAPLLLDVAKPEIVIQAEKAHLTPAYIYFVSAEEALMNKNYAEAIINAAVATEHLIRDYLVSRDIEPGTTHRELFAQLEQSNKLPSVILHELKQLWELRNKTVHLAVLPTRIEAIRAVSLARLVFEGLKDVWKMERRCVICGNSEVVGEEREHALDMSKIKQKKDLDRIFNEMQKGKLKGRLTGYYCRKHEPYWATH